MQVRHNKNMKTYSIKHIKQIISLIDKAECTGNCNGTPNCNLLVGDSPPAVGFSPVGHSPVGHSPVG